MKEEDVSKAVSEVISLNRTALDEYKNPPDQRHNHANIVKNFQQEYTAYLETWAFKPIRWDSWDTTIYDECQTQSAKGLALP